MSVQGVFTPTRSSRVGPGVFVPTRDSWTGRANEEVVGVSGVDGACRPCGEDTGRPEVSLHTLVQQSFSVSSRVYVPDDRTCRPPAHV